MTSKLSPSWTALPRPTRPERAARGHDGAGTGFAGAQLPPRAREVGISAWAPERACVRLNWDGHLRPDALAVIRVGRASIVMFVERDLGTERGGTLSQKVFKYGNVYGNRESTGPLHVGLVVGRNATSLRDSVAGSAPPSGSVRTMFRHPDPAVPNREHGERRPAEHAVPSKEPTQVALDCSHRDP